VAKYWESIYIKLSDSKLYPIYLIFFSLISSLIVYIRFYDNFSVIPRYWDGPDYLYVAKTLYNIPVHNPFESYNLTPAYFACHLPLYPLLIRLFSFLGYPVSMIFVTLIFSSLCTLAFYYLLKELKCVHNPFFSAFISIFLPARWLIYHSVGASEPLFIFLAVTSLYFFYKKNYLLAFVLASLCSVTRITGILFCLVYFILLIDRKDYKWILGLAIIPLSLFVTFLFYQYQFGNFFAYFNWNSKLIHTIPGDVLRIYANAGKAHPADLYLAMYFIFGLGAMLLWEYPVLFAYSVIFFYFNLFVFHEDLGRYYLGITHFTLIVAYDKLFKTWQFKVIFILFLPFVYLYVWGLIPTNVMVKEIYEKLLTQIALP